jgi:hypothetical protein
MAWQEGGGGERERERKKEREEKRGDKLYCCRRRTMCDDCHLQLATRQSSLHKYSRTSTRPVPPSTVLISLSLPHSLLSFYRAQIDNHNLGFRAAQTGQRGKGEREGGVGRERERTCTTHFLHSSVRRPCRHTLGFISPSGKTFSCLLKSRDGVGIIRLI